MKKLFVILLLPVLLLGCGAEPVFEQVEDVYGEALPPAARLEVLLPEEASVLTGSSDGTGQIYFCDGYTLTTQILNGGDLDRSLRALTGYGCDSLTVLETVRQGNPCFSCAWTSAGEGGDQVGRLVLLDDGAYHYAVTVMAPAGQAGDLSEIWDGILSRITLANTDS